MVAVGWAAIFGPASKVIVPAPVIVPPPCWVIVQETLSLALVVMVPGAL
jgi:hypothetical protein